MKLFDDILDTSMLLILNPPLPDALVPGYSRYVAAVDALEAVALQLLQVCTCVAWLEFRLLLAYKWTTHLAWCGPSLAYTDLGAVQMIASTLCTQQCCCGGHPDSGYCCVG
jgi:hypothetical protein